MAERNDGGPAFPLFFPESKTREGKTLRARDEHYGMTLRDYFAAQALLGLLTNATQGEYDDFARWAYSYADAMLAEREKGNTA